jgi:hypothetical protein
MNEPNKIHIRTSNKNPPCHVHAEGEYWSNDTVCSLEWTGLRVDHKGTRGRAAIVKPDFIISCFLPAEVELTFQALNAWSDVPPPRLSPSTSDSQLPYKLHHQVINLNTDGCNNISGQGKMCHLHEWILIYVNNRHDVWKPIIKLRMYVGTRIKRISDLAMVRFSQYKFHHVGMYS